MTAVNKQPFRNPRGLQIYHPSALPGAERQGPTGPCLPLCLQVGTAPSSICGNVFA